jgi:hypothetical protein
MGQLVAVMGDALTDKLPACLQLLLERLRNEITRLAAVKVCGLKSPRSHPHTYRTPCRPARHLVPYGAVGSSVPTWSVSCDEGITRIGARWAFETVTHRRRFVRFLQQVSGSNVSSTSLATLSQQRAGMRGGGGGGLGHV